MVIRNKAFCLCYYVAKGITSIMKGFRALRLGSQGKVEFEVYPVLEEYAQQGSVGGLLEARLPWRHC